MFPIYVCGTREVRKAAGHTFYVVCATCALITAEYDNKAAAIRHATNHSFVSCRVCGAD